MGRAVRFGQATAKSSAVRTENSPLHSFNAFTDYVLDARWSPVHPAVFAAVDGQGQLTIWNLNTDVEVCAVKREGTRLRRSWRR